MTAPYSSRGAALLPHHGHARFVDQVTESGDDTLVCVGRIPVDSPFVRNGVAPGFVLLELAAQSAAIEVLARLGGGKPRPRAGFLARAHGLNWSPQGVPAGAPLTTTVRRGDSLPPLYMFRATVALEGVQVFGGEFSLYVGEETG